MPPVSQSPSWKTYPFQYYLLILEHAITAIHLKEDSSTSFSVFCPPTHLPSHQFTPSPLPQRSQAHDKASLDHRWGQADPERAHPSPCIQPYQSKTSCLFSPDQLSETEPTSGALTDRLGSGPRGSLGGVQGWPKGDGRDGAWWANCTTPNIHRKPGEGTSPFLNNSSP